MTTTKGMTIETSLTDEQALEVCSTMTGFGRNLYETCKLAPLTSNQMAWAHKLAMEKLHPPKDNRQKLGDFGPIAELFDRVTIKYPKLHFRLPRGRLLLAKAGDRSRHSGAINVSDGRTFGANTWYGRIDKDGKFFEARDCESWVVEFLKKFAKNPANVAAEYGRENGYCCFCGKQLVDERSTSVGYGPQCASRWGMSWGKKS